MMIMITMKHTNKHNHITGQLAVSHKPAGWLALSPQDLLFISQGRLHNFITSQQSVVFRSRPQNSESAENRDEGSACKPHLSRL